jgi:hypothetical protein
MLLGMADAKQAPVVLLWAGRLLPVGGVLYGMWPIGECGSAFFPSSGLDSWTAAACDGALANRANFAILLLVAGLIALGVVQSFYWRKPKGGDE